MRRYNINVKALIMLVLIGLMGLIVLISGLQALFGHHDKDKKDKNDRDVSAGTTVSASPSPSQSPLPTHTPRPSPTPDSEPQQTPAPSAPPPATPTPVQDAAEVIAAICLEPPEEHSEEETLARLQILATYDNRFQEVIDRLPGLPEMTGFELSVNPELLEFVLGWPGEQTDAAFTASEASGETQLLMQYDPRWGYESYGSGPVAFNGCGPTCLSMAVLHFTGNPNATPDKTARWAIDNDYYVTGSGTKWTMFSEGIREWGVGSKELPLWKGSILSALDKGNWVVMCMKKGDFTIYGHFIIVCGYSDEGFQVLDPFSRARSGKLWLYEDIEDQISNLWAVGITEDLMNAG